MPVLSIATIPCDGDDCGMPALTISGTLGVISQAMDAARKHGWLIENDLALCPRCAKLWRTEQKRLRRQKRSSLRLTGA